MKNYWEIKFSSKSNFFRLSIFIAMAAFLLCTGAAFADSHLTCPVEESEEEVFIVEESIVQENINETGKNKNISTTNSGEYKVWGPAAKYTPKPVKKAARKSTKKVKSKYPPIGVRYRVFVSNSVKSSGKYSKHLSSRKGRYVYQYINITPIIVREAKRNKISPMLLKALIETESGFNTYARGPSGALGLCQLMPGTARRMGVKDPFNPEQNIRGGARLLGMLIRQFGSVERALAAYNLGGGAVSRHGGIPSYAWRFIGYVKKRMRKW